MARLPNIYEVRPTPQGGRPVVGFDGSAVPRAMAGAGAVIGQLGEQWEREIDAQAVFEARRKLDEWERRAIYDPKDGAANKRGRDAFDLPNTLQKDYDEFAGKVTAGLGSERQRRLFGEVAQSRRGQILDWSNRYAKQQRDVYDEGQFQADVSSMMDRAALFPDKAGSEVAAMNLRTIGFMRSRGASEEQIAAAVKEQNSKTHGMVIGSMLNAGNGEQAADYLLKNRDSMTAESVLRAEAGLKETTARAKAQAFGDDAMRRGLTAADAIKEARDKFTGIEEDAALNEIKTRFTEADAVKARVQKEAGDAAWKIIAAGGGRRDVKPDLWNALTGPQQREINDYTEARWRRAKADAEGKEIKTDIATYGALMRLPPDQFAKVRLEAYQDKISRSDLKTLMDRQERILEPKEATKLFSEEQMIAAYRPLLGVKSDDKEWGEFMRAAQDNLSAARARLPAGKSLSPDDIRAELDRMVIEGEVESGSWYKNDPNKRFYQATPTERARFVPTIPDADRETLLAKFKERGIAKPTDEQIMTAFRRWKGL